MSDADRIRLHGREKYVLPARSRKDKPFSIRVGDILREMRLPGSRAPAVCSALKTGEFLEENALCLVSKTGPPSGQSTTVTYTYRFLDAQPSPGVDPWLRLRGALKDIFAELGGGENYLRKERDQFRGVGEDK
jgi:hypothetical protein